jgi:enoyl-CoA hydratase/carnithine racemase
LSIDYLKEGKIAIIVLNNLPTMNALDLKALKEFHDALVEFHDDDNLWVCIITGAGNEAFCSGIDLNSALSKSRNSHSLPPTLMKGLEMPKPLIAAVNGLALGGGLEIVLVCDIRIASNNATFGAPEVKLGFIPNWGGTQRIARQLSSCHASELLLTGKSIDAGEAYRMGLVNRVVEKDLLMSTAKEWAYNICLAAPLAVRAAKEAMLKGANLPLDEGLNLESALYLYLRNSKDFQEGIQAFNEKRPPRFDAR